MECWNDGETPIVIPAKAGIQYRIAMKALARETAFNEAADIPLFQSLNIPFFLRRIW
jgi:hypothetical protein